MALFRILLLAFILSGVFKFVTRILIPILRIRSAVKDQIKTQQQAQTKQNQAKAPKSQQKSSSAGEYIDFEEIK
ncbi:MAG: hypothetical protein ACK44S_05890 [Bacteroidota bacterium]|jgi:hypothetical protein